MKVRGRAVANVANVVPMRTVVSIAVAALALVVGVPAVAEGHSRLRCHDTADAALDMPIEIAGATGLYAAPQRRSDAMVVVFHGYGHTADRWRDRLRTFARELGVLTVAMDYPGSEVAGNTWQVQEGADASVKAAQAFIDRCRFETVIAYGVSMGGNASGLAVADTTELFDWWFDVEGAANVVETYAEARALAPANAFANEAYNGIKLEMGGDIEDAEARPNYLERAIVNRVDDVVASGIQSVVMVHAMNDGLVPYNQSRELAALLRDRDMPVDFTTVGRQDSGEAGTTIDGYLNDYYAHESPLAGHASETSPTHIVNRIAFDRLRALLRGDAPVDRDELESYPPG